MAKYGTITPSQRFAARMVEIRQRVGMSQEAVAIRLTELGLPTDQTTVSRYESGRRAISIDVALAISAALGQSPVAMFSDTSAFAVKADSRGIHRVVQPPRLEIAPGLVVGTGVFQAWLRGDRPLNIADERDRQRWQLGLPTRDERGQVHQVAEMVRDLEALIIETSSGQMSDAERDRGLALIDTMRGLLLLQKQALEARG